MTLRGIFPGTVYRTKDSTASRRACCKNRKSSAVKGVCGWQTDTPHPDLAQSIWDVNKLYGCQSARGAAPPGYALYLISGATTCYQTSPADKCWQNTDGAGGMSAEHANFSTHEDMHCNSVTCTAPVHCHGLWLIFPMYHVRAAERRLIRPVWYLIPHKK